MNVITYPARPTEKIPGMRAGHLRECLALIDELTPTVARAVRERCPEQHLDAIAEAPRLAWVPLDYGLELANAYHHVLGERATFNWGRTLMVRTTSRPWLRTTRDTAVRLFGLTPKGLYRFATQFYDAVYCHCGEAQCLVRDDGAVTIVLHGMPKPMLAAQAHLISVAGVIAGAFDFCRVRGDVSMHPILTGDHGCAFDAIWAERRTAAGAR
ncbi:hypothetical protein [Pendulispora albinea]|uniref:Uncharacterized protein n=1 Tax=Pendulispora albinea TaxID=2741071 RepID=A0ABZ2MBV5_9BACT